MKRLDATEVTARAIYRAMRDLSNFGDDGKEQVVRRVHELLQSHGWPSAAVIAERMVRHQEKGGNV